MDNLQNAVLIEAINYYKKKFPSYVQYVLQDKVVLWIQLADIVTNSNNDITDEDIWNFIQGIFKIPLIQINEDDKGLKEQVENLTRSINMAIKRQFQNELIEDTIDGDEEIQWGGIKIPITVKKIKRYMEMHGLNAYSREDIQKIQDEFVNLQMTKNRLQKETLPLVGLSSKFTPDYLEKIFQKLTNKGITKSHESGIFLSLFTDNPLGRISWECKITGAQASLFCLMETITGNKVSASKLKKYFYSSSPIRDNWRDKHGANTKLIDEILRGL